MATAVGQASEITLRGSVAIVTEFFGFAVNSILFQRGIYPPESFESRKKYGLGMMVTSDAGLTQYLDNVLRQIQFWLDSGKLQRLVLVVSSIADRETLERWTFNIQADAPPAPGILPNPPKTEKEVHAEIQAIIRQVTASVTFLPLLDQPCSFDLLVYTTQDADVPVQWEESDPRYITNAAEVKLRSFSTRVHKVDTAVAYKMD